MNKLLIVLLLCGVQGLSAKKTGPTKGRVKEELGELFEQLVRQSAQQVCTLGAVQQELFDVMRDLIAQESDGQFSRKTRAELIDMRTRMQEYVQRMSEMQQELKNMVQYLKIDA